MNARNGLVRARRSVALVAAALIVTGTSAGAATAADSQGGKSAKYCVVTVGKSVDGGYSPVKSESCSDDPNASAFKAAAAPDVLLMEWFWNAYNSPPKLTRIISDEGECDSSGYRLRPNLIWDNEISGFYTYSHCHKVTLYDGYSSNGDSAYWYSAVSDGPDVDWVGPYMNDRTSSIWIRR
ncbi:hypothetical protein [Kribbella sp. NPDC004875]|uniref:hypothetical protein n=1 Tax=Kribbella sp. NPDC004875 TaxID=3364107 RepID=UPI0036CF996E